MRSRLFCLGLSIILLVFFFNGCSSTGKGDDFVQQELIEVAANPGEIEYNKEIDIVFSLDKDEFFQIDNLEKSEVVLSGVFSGLEVDSIVSKENTFDIRIHGDLQIEHLYYEDDWVKDDCGLIKIMDQESTIGYIAEIAIAYDELEVAPESVEISENQCYSFEISLSKGEFNKAVEIDDVVLKGAFKDFEILDTEKIDNSSFRVFIKGDTEGIGSGIIHLNNTLHPSGLSMDVLIKIINEAKLFTSEIIFNDHYLEEEIILHLQNSKFNVNISHEDIMLGGMFDGLDVNRVEYLDESNVKLILMGKLNKNIESGLITVTKEGTDFHRSVQTTVTQGDCKVVAYPSIIISAKDNQINDYSFTLKSFTVDFPLDLMVSDIKLSGAVSGMKVSSVKRINKKECDITLSGSPKTEGTGIITIGDNGLVTVNISVDHASYVFGRVYLDKSIENLTFEITNQAGEEIHDNVKLNNGSDGAYFIEIDNHLDLGQYFRITAKGDYQYGDMVKQVTLVADVDALEQGSTIIGINAITTLTALYRDNHPEKSSREAENEIAQYLSLPENNNFNGLLVENISYFSHEEFMKKFVNIELNEYFEQILSEIDGIDRKETYNFAALTDNSQNKSGISTLEADSGKISFTEPAAGEATFDYNEIVGSAAKSIAGAAGTKAFEFALNVMGVDTVSSQLQEISSKLDELQKIVTANAEKQLAATYKSAFDVRMDTLNHDVNTINDLLIQVRILEKSTGTSESLEDCKKRLIQKIEDANIRTILSDINSQMTGVSSLMDLYKDYLKASLPFRYEVVAPMENLYTYCMAAQADGLLLYGIYSNQKSDNSYLKDLYEDLKTTTIKNISDQKTLVPKIDEGGIAQPGNLYEIQQINGMNFYFPYTNDGTRWCLWGSIFAGTEWFDGDLAHYDNGTNWTRSERWYESYYRTLDSWGYRPLSVNDADLLKSQFLKNCSGSAHSFLSGHGMNIGEFTRFYLKQDSFTVYYITEDTCTSDSFTSAGHYQKAIDDAYKNQSWMVIFRLR